MRLSAFLIFLFALLAPLTANAREQIDNFDVRIDVQKDGDVIVRETIAVTSEGYQIRRGIFRDLPRFYAKNGGNYPYDYDVIRIERDGRKERYAIEKDGNAYRIRIGDKDVFLENGSHVYEIEYRVKNQVRYFDDYDEIYWNATGNYWAFPIVKAQATVTLPPGARTQGVSAYTGGFGQTGSAYDYTPAGNDHIFTATKALERGEGMTVAVGFQKGVVDPPSASDLRSEWWARNVSSIVLLLALGGLAVMYPIAWHRIGRDPLKGPVFPRYEPPEDMSPAAVHHVLHRRLAGNTALIASLLNLAVKDRMKIDAKSKKKTELTRLEGEGMNVSQEEENLLNHIFRYREHFTLGEKYDAAFTNAYTDFKKEIGKDYGQPYFKWNHHFLALGIVLTICAFILAIKLSVGWTFLHTLIVAALVIASVVFSYFIPAPTKMGQEIRTAIEGFRLYLKTAEKLQLNAAKPGTDAPPPMSVERYEKFLPYAVALGVERPWTRHFERLLPKEAADYHPRWTNMRSGNYNSVGGLNRALVGAMSSGVVSALPQSSSSSGSGGGGFSGGGGGGGGGGGW